MGEGAAIRISNGSHQVNAVSVYNHFPVEKRNLIQAASLYATNLTGLRVPVWSLLYVYLNDQKHFQHQTFFNSVSWTVCWWRFMIEESELNKEGVEAAEVVHRTVLGRMLRRRERSLLSFPCTPWHQFPRPCSPFFFFSPAWSQQYSHDGAALGLVLAEGGGEQLCLAGQV